MEFISCSFQADLNDYCLKLKLNFYLKNYFEKYAEASGDPNYLFLQFGNIVKKNKFEVHELILFTIFYFKEEMVSKRFRWTMVFTSQLSINSNFSLL